MQSTGATIHHVLASGGLSGSGAFIPRFAPAHLVGSSRGGSFPKQRTVQPGFRLELNIGSGYIITSPVRHVTSAGDTIDPADIM